MKFRQLSMIKSDKKYYLFILFLIWPFGTLLLAIRKFTEEHYRFIILLFSILFGYSVYLFSGDILRYEQAFYEIITYEWGDYFHLLLNSFSADKLAGFSKNVVNTQPDVYALSLQFLTSRLTEDPRWFWAIVSLLYTYFFIQFLSEVIKETELVKTIPQIIFISYLVLLIPYYYGVTGVRFWTAVFIFMLCVMRYIRYQDAKYIIIAAFTILVHYAFILPVGLLLFYRFIPSNRYVIAAMMIVSIGFFAASSNTQILTTIENNMGIFSGTAIEDRADSYTNQDILEAKQERGDERNWYVKLRGDSILFFLIILFPLEAMGVFGWKTNEFTRRLFPMILLFFCITLLTYNLGSIGRFKNIFYLLCLVNYSVLAGLNPKSRSLNLVAYFLAPLLLLHLLVTFRALFYWIDPLLIIGNPIVIYLFRSDESLSEFIVGH
jgi:hypothetical protein